MSTSERELAESVKQFYEKQAQQNPRYAAVLAEPNFFAASYRDYAERRQFDGIVSLDQTDRFVEFGCGGGRWLEHVASAVGAAIGVEMSSKCVQIARARLKKYQNVRVIESDARDFTPKTDTTFIYYAGVLLYICNEKLDAVLHQHLASSRAANRVLIRDSLAENKTHVLDHPAGYQATYRTKQYWIDQLGKCGFRLASQTVANSAPLSAEAKVSITYRLRHKMSSILTTDTKLFESLHDQNFDPAASEQFVDGYRHDFLLFQRLE